MDYSLLKELCAIHATAGDEGRMTDYILRFFEEKQDTFRSKPKIYSGADFQDMVIAVFGTPRTAIFAHTDTVAYCTSYQNNLIKIGNPKAEDGTLLQGYINGELVSCKLRIKKAKVRGKSKLPSEETYSYEGSEVYPPGTPLTYVPQWKETKNFVKCAYMDDRLGVWNALQQASELEHGALVFSTYEETGGGGAQVAGRFLREKYGVRQALISDVTLLSTHIKHHKGVAISMRDRGIPRQVFVRKIIELARAHNIPHQLEIENAGGSDGISLQMSSWAWDWCFIGPPEDRYHQPGEKVAKADIAAMVQLYALLMKHL